jgi:hypothetical protein
MLSNSWEADKLSLLAVMYHVLAYKPGCNLSPSEITWGTIIFLGGRPSLLDREANSIRE